jgi:hypothetical protein
MPRGPLPNPQSRRRNAPTIATTVLPAAGRKGRAPAVPTGYKLKSRGRAWWNWAWKLPQATRWDAGTRYFVARRAALEDDLEALEQGEGFNFDDLLADLDIEDAKSRRDTSDAVEFIVRRLKALAGARTGVMKEMRELDNRLGLNPKAMADLRWSVEEVEETPTPKARGKSKSKGRRGKSKPAKVTKLDEYRDRL